MGNAVSSGGAPRTALAPNHQQDKTDPAQQGHTASTQQEPPVSFWQVTWQRTLDDPVALYTLILAVATTLLWLFTAALWRVTYRLSLDAKASGETQADKMERSIAEAAKAAAAMEEMADAAHAANRPWIDLTMLAKSVVIYDDRFTVEFTVTLQNIGNTPALNVVMEITSDTPLAPSRGLLTNETAQLWDTRPRGAYLPQRKYFVTRSMAFQWGNGTAIDPEFGWQPSITVSAKYDLPAGGSGHTARSFLIGRDKSKPSDTERIRLADRGTTVSLFAKALQGDKAE